MRATPFDERRDIRHAACCDSRVRFMIVPFIRPVAIIMSHAHLHLQADRLYHFDARGIAKRFRHAAIFGALDALTPGETMRFCNDHDPIPLLRQLAERYGDKVQINYVQKVPGEVVIDFARVGA
jgi:uncharacterized protein (DUF2249 family)